MTNALSFYAVPIVLLRTRCSMEAVRLPDIVCISADDKCCHIHTVDGKIYTLAVCMKEVEGDLPQDVFVRIHRSHIINLSHITRIIGNMVIMKTDIRVFIGKAFKDVIPRYIHVYGLSSTPQD